MTPTIKMEYKREPRGGGKTYLRNAPLCYHFEDYPASAFFP